MITILSPAFVSLGTIDIADLVAGQVQKEDSGGWHLQFTVVHDEPAGVHLARENYVQYDAQKYTIEDVVVERDGEERYIKVSAQHVVHELERYPIEEGYQFTGTLQQHVNKLLELQPAADYTYVNGIGDMYTLRRAVTITPGTMAQGLKTILAHYNARLVMDNYVIEPVPRTTIADSGVMLEYGVQNDKVARTYSRDKVVTRLLATATLDEDTMLDEPEPEPFTKTYGGDGGYRHGITQAINFGTLHSEVEMDWLANEYLSMYSEPDATYELTFAELKRISNIAELYPARDFAIDVGMGVTVQDAGLGINTFVAVKRYSYSLTRPEELSRVTLGSLRTLRLLPEREDVGDVVKEEGPDMARMRRNQNTIAWAEIVMRYVLDVLGSDIRGVAPELLMYTTPTSTYGKSRKTLNNAITALDTISGGTYPVVNTTRIFVEDPIANINAGIARQYTYFLRLAYENVLRFVLTTTGGSFGTPTLVSRINAVYASVYGVGQIAGYTEDTVGSVFGTTFSSTSDEYRFAEFVLTRLNARVGNVSEIYLELGGGNSGVVGAINKLHNMLITTGITVSADYPDNAVGKDGDLWFRFED